MSVPAVSRFVFAFWLVFWGWLAGSGQAFGMQSGPIPPIQSGYGANGPYSIKVETLPSPRFSGQNVTVYFPTETTTPLPVVFFSHGFGAINPRTYEPFIRHIASRGYIVVYAPYPVTSPTIQERYQVLLAGFVEAASTYRPRMDLSRVGFVGHSFGAGATPAIAYQGITQQGWGSAGVFLFMLAPWYSYDITPEQLSNFPPQTKLIVQVYDDDAVCDHRMAKDIFTHISIPDSEKDYVVLFSDRSEALEYQLKADHLTPTATNPGRSGDRSNALDFYGVWRLFDALAEYTFQGTSDAKIVALGNGNVDQSNMGTWPAPENRPVKPLLATDSPVVTHPESDFAYGFSNVLNPRRGFGDVNTASPVVSNVTVSNTKIIRRRDSTVTITWTSTDDQQVISHDLSFASNGTDFSVGIVSGLSGAAQAFTWRLPTDIEPTKTGVVKVVAKDAAGNSGQALSGKIKIR